MTQCDKCRSSASCERPWKGMDGYLNCVSFDPIITNGDKMRAMTDEELAEFLLNRDLDVVEKATKAVGFTYKVDREPCLVNVIDWLTQEAEENE